MDKQKILVLGTGRSGVAAAKQILAMGGEVIFFDKNPKVEDRALLSQFKKKDKVSLIKGKLLASDLLHINASVISPGIPLDEPYVKMLSTAQIPQGKALRGNGNQRKDHHGKPHRGDFEKRVQ